jgi:hypothetical protein
MLTLVTKTCHLLMFDFKINIRTNVQAKCSIHCCSSIIKQTKTTLFINTPLTHKGSNKSIEEQKRCNKPSTSGSCLQS